MEITIQKVKHRIDRLKAQLYQYGTNPQKHYNTYNGGMAIGILRGKISILEDILDELLNTQHQ